MIISDLEKLNTEKISQMSILYDLAKSITNNLILEYKSKHDVIIENTTIRKILQKLPENITIHIMNYEEYSLNKTKEANLVHEVDKLELAYQARIYTQNNKLLNLFLDYVGNKIKNRQLKKIIRFHKKLKSTK